MPELPEVEVTRRELSPRLLGRVIERARTTKPSYFFLTPPRPLARRLKQRRAESLERRGKYLLHKPYVIAAMILATRFADPAQALLGCIDRADARRRA